MATDEQKYEKWIKKQRCCQCMKDGPGTWHHLIGLGIGVLSGKAFWLLTVPICGLCHTNFHTEVGKNQALDMKQQYRWLDYTQRLAVAENILIVNLDR